MARVDMDVKSINTAGVDVLDAANSELIGNDGVAFPNNGRVYLMLYNTTSGAVNVTIATPATFDTDLELDDRVVAVPGDGALLVGVFPTNLYNQANGNIDVDAANNDEIRAAAFYARQ